MYRYLDSADVVTLSNLAETFNQVCPIGIYNLTTTLLPHYYLTITSLLPHYYPTTTSLLPYIVYRYLDSADVVTLSNLAETFNQVCPIGIYYLTTTSLLPHYYPTALLLLHSY